MTLKTFEVTLETPSGGKRVVTVPSPSGVQAGDACIDKLAENTDRDQQMALRELYGPLIGAR